MNRRDLGVCSFYAKIGACRHGEKCSKRHVRPNASETLLLANLYQNPKLNKNSDDTLSSRQITEQFEHFFQDIFTKFATLGEVQDLVVCENENFHLNGNVYVRYKDDETAYQASLVLNQEWYGGRPVYCELSPVQSFQEANCRAHDTNSCSRGENCNFMHTIRPSKELKTKLFQAQDKSYILKKLAELREDPKEKSEEKTNEVKTDEKDAAHEKKAPVTSTSAVEMLFK